MQTIDPTFQSYKDPGFDDIWDPEANIRSSMNYAMATYGSLSAAYDRAGGYKKAVYYLHSYATPVVYSPITLLQSTRPANQNGYLTPNR